MNIPRKQRVGVVVEAVGQWMSTNMDDGELDALVRALYATKPTAKQRERVKTFYEAHKEAVEQ